MSTITKEYLIVATGKEITIGETTITTEDGIEVSRKNSVIIEKESTFEFTPRVGMKLNVFEADGKKYYLEIESDNYEERREEDEVKIIVNNVGSRHSSDEIIINKTSYVIMALFLGGLGVHKFSTGRVGIGLIYLLFSLTGIPSIIGFIEGCIALSKEADMNGNIVVGYRS